VRSSDVFACYTSRSASAFVLMQGAHEGAWSGRSSDIFFIDIGRPMTTAEAPTATNVEAPTAFAAASIVRVPTTLEL
jgi:hypothetical protein